MRNNKKISNWFPGHFLEPKTCGPNPKSGFTVIELLLVLGIIIIVSTVSFISLRGRKSVTDLASTAAQIVATLREAESRSVSQVSGTAWGVYFENNTTSGPFFAIFSGGTYATSSKLSLFRLSPQVGYVTSSLDIGASKQVIFSQISGKATSTSIAVFLKVPPNISSTISIATSGAIGY